MDPSLWQKIQNAFEATLELNQTELELFLADLEKQDPAVASEVRSLLAVDVGRVDQVVPAAMAGAAAELDSPSRIDADSLGDVPLPVDRLGPFRLRRLLGMGGMGAVYLGEREDADFEQRVALKVVRQTFLTAPAKARFLNERRILAGLQHERIARLVDGGLADDGVTPWFAMEFVDGEPFLNALSEASLERRLNVFLDICDAVQYAHRRLVVHRDLKPSNILIGPDGRPKLLDFGIAKVLNPGSGATEAKFETQTGERPMTPSYAAPEQLVGEPVTIATDIYALGMLLYELLVGRHPFVEKRSSAADLEQAILHNPPTRPSRVIGAAEEETRPYEAKALSGDLDNICLTALRKEPERRYATVGDLAADIRRFLEDQPVSATPDSWAYRARKLVRRHRVPVVAVTLSVLMLILMSTIYGIRLADERDRALAEAEKSSRLAGFLTELFTSVDPNQAQGEEITARQLLEQGVRRIDHELEQQPQARADLLHVMGDVYLRLGLYDRALELLQSAAEANEDLGADGGDALARTWFRMGEAHLYEERFDEADEFLSRALAFQRQAGEQALPQLADTLDMLGRLNRLRRQPDDAEPQHEEALEIRRRIFGPDSLEVSESLQSLGTLRQTQASPDEAVVLIRQALDIRLDHLGPDHAETLELRQNLASVLQRLGDPEGSLAMYHEALPSVRKIYGEDHQNVGWTLNGIAYALQQVGRLDEAVEYDRQAVEIFRRRGGGPAGVTAMVQLSRHLTQVDKLEEAEAAAREALVWLQDTPDKPDPKRSNVLVDLGTILTRQERYEDAEEALKETLRLDIHFHGEDHAYVAQDRYKLGDLARVMGRPNVALEWLDLALKRQRRFKPGAVAFGLSLSCRGLALLDLDRASEAEAAFRESVDVFGVYTPDTHPDAAEAKLGLGLSLGAQGRMEEGRELAEDAVEKLRETLGVEHPRVLRASESLRQLTDGGA